MWYLSGKPYKVQLVAQKKAEGKRGWAHWLEMGLGKTNVTLNEYLTLFYAGEIEIMVVVAPFTAVESVWEAEITKWAGHQQMEVICWPNRPPFLKKGPKVFLVYYEALAVGYKQGQQVLDQLLEQYKCFLVIEEAIEIKNPTATRTKYLIARAPQWTVIRELCGWPMVGGPHDLWSQLRAMDGIRGFKFFPWRSKFCRMGGFKNRKVVGVREDNEPELHDIMRRHGWEAKKNDWTDLPPKRVLPPIHCGLTDKQRHHYREMAEEFITILDSGQEITSQMVATQMNKLQQISSGFLYDERRRVHIIEPEPPKLKHMKQIIADNPRNKFIIFYSYLPSFDILIAALVKDFGVCVMAGNKTHDQLGINFEQQKRAFNESDTQQVALCQQAASKYGLTLLGTTTRPCHNVFYWENIYDLNARIQSEDRPHRHGQLYQVDYQDFVSSPVELAAITALTERRDLTGGVMLKAFRNALIDTVRGF